MTLLQIFQLKGWLNGRNILADDIMNAMAIEKRKWYSLKRFITSEVVDGDESCSFSDQEEEVKEHDRYWELWHTNKEKGLTKQEHAEILKLLSYFKSRGKENKYWRKVEKEDFERHGIIQ